MDQRLTKACEGKTASQGGLNVKELAEIAKGRGYKGEAKRSQLIEFLCKGPAQPAPVLAPVPAIPVPVAAVPVMEPALVKACRGKTKSAGGLNTDELIIRAAALGYIGPNTRPDLIAFLCKNVSAPVKNQPLKIGLAAHYDPLDIQDVEMPKLPRGQVGINTEAWKARKPTGKTQRRAVFDKCGKDCFLEPDELSYPICTEDCKQDCHGLRAAVGLTSLINNRHGVSLPAKEKAKRARSAAIKIGVAKCGWVRK